MPQTPRLTPAEWELMETIWSLGGAPSVREVVEEAYPNGEKAYTTVQTMMALLRDKGFLASRREGRADVYRPLVGREAMGRHSLRRVMDLFFSGSASSLVSHLVNLEGVSDEEIRAMQRAVQDRDTAD